MIRKVWTKEEIDILSRMYPDHFAKVKLLPKGGIQAEYQEKDMIGN